MINRRLVPLERVKIRSTTVNNVVLPSLSNSANWLASANTFVVARSGSNKGIKAIANCWNGWSPGMKVATSQVRAGGLSRRSKGNNPAWTTDDLPLPEGPMTTTRPRCSKVSLMRWANTSRPQKNAALSSLNGRKPW